MRETTSKRPFVCFALSILLGLCILGWGTHYKLSLYQPQTVHSSQEPAAKLLSEQQKPIAQAPQATANPFVFTPLVLFAMLLTWGAAISTLPAFDDFQTHFSEMFLFGCLLRRPPPALAARP